jgi:hypothetical protein
MNTSCLPKIGAASVLDPSPYSTLHGMFLYISKQSMSEFISTKIILILCCGGQLLKLLVHYQRMTFMTKSRIHEIRGMLAIIQSRIFCLPVSYKKNLRKKCAKHTLREEHRLRVFENSMFRKIFGPKREEEGSCRKLHKDEIHNLYSSPNIVRVIKSRRMRWVGHVARR